MKVFVEDDNLIEDMFIKMGWKVVTDPQDSDLICFTGGSDVSPMLYETVKHPNTFCNPVRDQECCDLFYKYVDLKPMVGICRGAQFLNVMCGGDLYQHVDNHNKGYHEAMDPETGRVYEVTSAHHQMMIPEESGKLFLITNKSTIREPDMGVGYFEDVEGVFYEEENCLCYQPHPEYVEINHECCKLFFDLIKDYLGLES